MSELFKDDDMNQLFFDITLTAKQQSMITELVKMNQEVIGSTVFGYVLYDNGTFPVMTNIDRDFFAENYMVILAAMAKAGVHDSYTFLIKQVLGDGVAIEYSYPAPRHLKINIPNIESYESKLITDDNLWLATSDNFGIVATKTISEFTVSQLKKVLEILANPSGTYLELSFGQLVTVISVSIDQDFSNLTIGSGYTYQFTGTATYSDGTTKNSVDNPELFEWVSGNETILTFDSESPGLATFSSTGYGEAILISTEDAAVTDLLIFSITLNFDKFPIVVGEGLMGEDRVIGVFNTVTDGSYGEFLDDTWISSESNTDYKAYLTARFLPGGSIQVFFYSSSRFLWRDWSGINISISDGVSDASLNLNNGPEYSVTFDVSDEASYAFVDMLERNIGNNIDVSLLEYGPTADEVKEEKANLLKLGIDHVRINK